jgi:hypothetical protein
MFVITLAIYQCNKISRRGDLYRMRYLIYIVVCWIYIDCFFSLEFLLSCTKYSLHKFLVYTKHCLLESWAACMSGATATSMASFGDRCPGWGGVSLALLWAYLGVTVVRRRLPLDVVGMTGVF